MKSTDCFVSNLSGEVTNRQPAAWHHPLPNTTATSIPRIRGKALPSSRGVVRLTGLRAITESQYYTKHCY